VYVVTSGRLSGRRLLSLDWWAAERKISTWTILGKGNKIPDPERH
jgi:hypothetical protein